MAKKNHGKGGGGRKGKAKGKGAKGKGATSNAPRNRNEARAAALESEVPALAAAPPDDFEESGDAPALAPFNLGPVKTGTDGEEAAAADERSEDSECSEGEERWKVDDVFGEMALGMPGAKKCAHCNKLACVRWVSTHGEEDFVCVDHQESEYGGWPGLLPITHLSKEDHAAIVLKCSESDDPAMPFEHPMLAVAREGKQYTAVLVNHATIVILDPTGSGFVGKYQHAVFPLCPVVSGGTQEHQSWVLVLDVTLRVENIVLEESGGNGGSGEDVAEEEALFGSQEFLNKLTSVGHVQVKWAEALDDVELVCNLLNKLNREQALLVVEFLRGSLSTGRGWLRALRILKTELLFRTFLERIETTYNIHHGWVLANLSGNHGFHGDTLQRRASHRIVATFAGHGKVMCFREMK